MLANIERTGQQAFAEMRTLVGVLRADEHEIALAPQPAIAEIPALIAEFTSSSLEVAMEAGGEPRPAPPGVELAAYRIVQEALTNCLKHAAPTHARVIQARTASSGTRATAAGCSRWRASGSRCTAGSASWRQLACR